MIRVFLSDETGSLGASLEVEAVPRVGELLVDPRNQLLGEFLVKRVTWWTWGLDTVSLLVERAPKETPL